METVLKYITDFLRAMFFFFDGIVYSVIDLAYNLFSNIANTTIFTEDVINLFAGKVYAILGIFMLFKVSFSIMTYIVNPDEFADKTKGFSKIISNIVLTLFMLLITPWVFSQAMDIQRIVLKDNIIGKIFSATSIESTVFNASAGQIMSYETFRAFYYIDVNDPAFDKCKGYETNTVKTESECVNQFPAYEKYKTNLYLSSASKRLDLYMDSNLVTEKNADGKYVMTYMPLISTAAGVFIAWVLIMFCFDIAVRSVKLGFLRIIAPVPIISRIDPKGKDIFSKWFKTCLSTYLDLFVRLIAINFAIFVISQFGSMDFVNASTGLGIENESGALLIKVFIIMGALLFAKQLPKLLQDLTGMHIDGKFNLNPFKKVAEVPVVGKLSHTAIGAADSMFNKNGFWSGVKRNWKDISIMGGDGKISIFETSDRKMRREINEKRDYAKQRYQGLDAIETLEKQMEFGEEKFVKIKSGSEQAGKSAFEAAINSGKSIEEAEKLQKQAEKSYKASAEQALYGSVYYESKRSVDEAKANMYAWENKVTTAQEIYSNAVSKYGANSAEAQQTYRQFEDVKQKAGSARGQYEYRNTQHKNLKNSMPEKAKIEDAIEAFEKMGAEKFTDANRYAVKDLGAEENISTVEQEQVAETPNDVQNIAKDLEIREAETRKEMDEKHQRTSETFNEYYMANGDPSASEERRMKLYEEYKVAKEEEEKTIAEHTRIVAELNRIEAEQQASEASDNESTSSDENQHVSTEQENRGTYNDVTIRKESTNSQENEYSESTNSQPLNSENDSEMKKLLEEYAVQEKKTEAAKKVLEQKEKEFNAIYKEYMKAMSDPVGYAKTMAEITEKYRNAVDEREKALFEHEREEDKLREIALKVKSMMNPDSNA